MLEMQELRHIAVAEVPDSSLIPGDQSHLKSWLRLPFPVLEIY